MEYEKTRAGIGEHGAAGHTLPEEEGERRRLFDSNGFNALLSMYKQNCGYYCGRLELIAIHSFRFCLGDKIALNRSVADIRHTG